MPRKTKVKNAAIAERSAALPKILQELLDQIVQGATTAGAIQDVTMALKNYGTEVSPDVISSVTDVATAEVTAWQARPLEPMYPVVFFDARRVKVRKDAAVRNKAIYLALACCPTARATSWGCGSRTPQVPRA